MTETKKELKKVVRNQTTIKAYGTCACSCSCPVAPAEATASSGRYQTGSAVTGGPY